MDIYLIINYFDIGDFLLRTINILFQRTNIQEQSLTISLMPGIKNCVYDDDFT